MPKRLDSNTVRQAFIDAGYEPPADFKYKNNKTKYRMFDYLNNKYVQISYQTLQYNLKKGHRPTWSMLPLPLPDEQLDEQPTQPTQKSPQERFYTKHSDVLISFDSGAKQVIYDQYKGTIQQLTRKRDFILDLPTEDEELQRIHLTGIMLALRDTAANILKKHDLTLCLTNINDRERYFNVNPTTLDDLYNAIMSPEIEYRVEDSSDFGLINTNIFSTISFSFSPTRPGRRVTAGFFPMINTDLSTDLSRYAIYTSIDTPEIATPCILTAFKSSGVLTESELNQLSNMIRVRNFPQTDLQRISKHFKINIYVRNYRDDSSKSKTSHVDYSDPSYTRSIKLCIYLNHYMLYEVDSSTKKSNYMLIKQMIKDNKLRPITDNELENKIKIQNTEIKNIFLMTLDRNGNSNIVNMRKNK